MAFGLGEIDPDQAILRLDLLPLTSYIPVGSLRIRQTDVAVLPEEWNSCLEWRIFPRSRNVQHLERDTPLPQNIQEALLASLHVYAYPTNKKSVNNQGWTLMEFKINETDRSCGQIRVSVLPEDVGRMIFSRNDPLLRRQLHAILCHIDSSKSTWAGKWSIDTPVDHIGALGSSEDNMSLFQMFQKLPSPTPTPEAILDPYAKEAMKKVLASDVPNLKTSLYQYQRESTAMMIQREADSSPTIDPRLVCMLDIEGSPWYCDIEAATCYKEPTLYDTVRGGILAENMGHGYVIAPALILPTQLTVIQ